MRGTCCEGLPQGMQRRASGGFWMKVLALTGAVARRSGILRPLPTFDSWGNQGPERGGDLPIVMRYSQLTAIRSQLPYLPKRGIGTPCPARRVPGAETGGG